MPRGYYRHEYFHNPKINKSIEEIYEDYSVFSAEIFPDETHQFSGIDLMVPLPPTYYEGKFIKGLCLSQGADALNYVFPEFSELFNVMAYSMTPSFPWAISADAYLVMYDNPHRNAWYREKNPHHANLPLIPLQDADFLHEYDYPPPLTLEKDLDFITVSRMHDLKNLPFLAKVMKVYRQKYPKKKMRLTMVIGKEFDVNMESLTPHERDQYREIERELIHPQDYIDLVPVARWFDELPNLYARSKICFLGALIEGKNRSIQEAMCCNTPVICNVEYNQYVRGNTAIVPEGTGLYSYFDAEAWADTIHEILNNYGDFKPRRKYLEGYGRRKFLNTCMDLIPYYKEHLPGYEEGNHHRNMHLDLAVSHHYQVSLMDFLYGKRHWLTHVRGVEQIREVIQKYVEALSAGSDFKTRPGSFFQSWSRPLMGRVDEGVLEENPGYQYEFHYWRAVLSLEFGEGQERILDRLIPDRMVHVYPREVISYLQQLTESLGRKPKVLDVGSGPVSIFGYGVQNNLIDLNAVDPLATQYIEVLDKLGYSLKHSLLKGFGEELSVLFGADAFDLVWTENAIDHCISPSKVLEEMVKVVRPGGYVFLKCWTREGTFEEWSGLHQHDIHLNENKELVCESNSPDKAIKTLSIMNKGLPLELVYSTPPSTEIRSQILMIWKKKPHYGF